jgi:PAS domain S-box-containing protein
MVLDSPIGLPPDLLRSIDGCGDPIVVVGERWDIVHWNDAAETTLGHAAADVRGRRCYEVIAGIDDGGREVCRLHCEKWALARRGAHIHNFDVRVLPTHERWANVSILPVWDANGRPVALAHIIRSIGRSKRLERFVQEIAAEADEVLTTHVGNGVVHEPTAIHLTNRELEVLRLLAHGAGTAVIADRLGVSPHTVHNHVAVVLNKLGVHSRAEAVAYAFEHHLA